MTGGATLINGNGGIRISSTEIYSDNTWRFAGNLPNTMWGMSAVTFNNRVLVFGTIQSYLNIYYKLFNPQVEIGALIKIRYLSSTQRLKRGLKLEQ